MVPPQPVVPQTLAENPIWDKVYSFDQGRQTQWSIGPCERNASGPFLFTPQTLSLQGQALL
jgi:hypothetical protein